MILIETPRLTLMPLTYEQLLLYILSDNSLEASLHLNPTIRHISPELKEALEETILPQVADKRKNYLFSTLWSVILKTDQKMVGDLCFIGEPNAAGEIEIGYGTYEAFRGQGYMSEAVGGMVAWAKSQPNVKAIVASTEKKNPASSRILQKNHFKQVEASESLLHWKLDLST